ncbi:MAG TPA: S8 family serine peptidase [Hyphomicrobiaceae bacterium]|nr:S8 family serine peptidase [Hyphomicrobiaceae bacterium]
MGEDDRSRRAGGWRRARWIVRRPLSVGAGVLLCGLALVLAVLPLEIVQFLNQQLLIGPANAGRDRNADEARRRAEEAAHEARRAAERAAREARRAAERAAQAAARAAQQARQTSQSSRNDQRDRDDRSDDRNDDRKDTANSNNDKGGRGDKNNRDDRNEGDDEKEAANDGDDGDESPNRRGGRTAKNADEPPPATIADLISRWISKSQPQTQWADSTSVIRLGEGRRQGNPMRVLPPETPPPPSPSNGNTPTTASPPPAQQKPASTPEPKPRARNALPALPSAPLPILNKRELLAINVGPQSMDRLIAGGFRTSESVDLSHLGFRMDRIEAPPGWDAAQARAWLKRELPNDRFEFNRTYRQYLPNIGGDGDLGPHGHPSPPAASDSCGTDRCYGAAAINWRPALATCARGVRIGVIDTAFDSALFSGRENVSYATAAATGHQKAASWHGNGVLTLLAGTSHGDAPGLIPDAKYFVADTFVADQDGSPVSDTASVLKALDLMMAFDVQIINMSLSGPRDPTVEKVISKLSEKGVIFVAAAGNGGPTAPPAYPAAYPPVIAVTAVNKHLNGYPYANRGNYIDVAAPGVRIWTALAKDRQDYVSGTSFAAPYVTAIVATLAGQGLTRKEALLERLETKDLGPAGRDQIYGRGLLLAPASCAPTRTPVASKGDAWRVIKTSTTP